MYDPTADAALARLDPPAEDDGCASLLVAAVVELARRDAAKGSMAAQGWLQTYVDGPAAAARRRGCRVRGAA